jgi:hypothetical protein
MSNGSWIKVEDQLPEELKTVIVFVRHIKPMPPPIKQCYVATDKHYRGKWSKTLAGREVTHWQPYPAPPEA